MTIGDSASGTGVEENDQRRSQTKATWLPFTILKLHVRTLYEVTMRVAFS